MTKKMSFPSIFDSNILESNHTSMAIFEPASCMRSASCVSRSSSPSSPLMCRSTVASSDKMSSDASPLDRMLHHLSQRRSRPLSEKAPNSMVTWNPFDTYDTYSG